MNVTPSLAVIPSDTGSVSNARFHGGHGQARQVLRISVPRIVEWMVLRGLRHVADGSQVSG
jgi:hypothetical protein